MHEKDRHMHLPRLRQHAVQGMQVIILPFAIEVDVNQNGGGFCIQYLFKQIAWR